MRPTSARPSGGWILRSARPRTSDSSSRRPKRTRSPGSTPGCPTSGLFFCQRQGGLTVRCPAWADTSDPPSIAVVSDRHVIRYGRYNTWDPRFPAEYDRVAAIDAFNTATNTPEAIGTRPVLDRRLTSMPNVTADDAAGPLRVAHLAHRPGGPGLAPCPRVHRGHPGGAQLRVARRGGPPGAQHALPHWPQPGHRRTVPGRAAVHHSRRHRLAQRRGQRPGPVDAAQRLIGPPSPRWSEGAAGCWGSPRSSWPMTLLFLLSACDSGSELPFSSPGEFPDSPGEIRVWRGPDLLAGGDPAAVLVSGDLVDCGWHNMAPDLDGDGLRDVVTDMHRPGFALRRRGGVGWRDVAWGPTSGDVPTGPGS